MKLLPLIPPDLIKLVSDWLSAEENYKWVDFGDGPHALSPVSLNIMTQRDIHVLRVFTLDDSDLPIGVVGLSDVRRHQKTAGSAWGVLGRKQYGNSYLTRAASKLLTHGFADLGLETIGAWTVDIDMSARRMLEQLHFRYAGRQRRRHWINGRAYDRLLYDLLATEHQAIPDEARARSFSGPRLMDPRPKVMRPGGLEPPAS